MSALLELRGVNVTIGHAALLRGMDLQLVAGDAVALVGASGSGKTTLLRTIMGLLPPHAVVAGERRWQGRDLARFSASAWRRLRGRGIGWIPQEPQAALDPRRTAAQHLGECLHASGHLADPGAMAASFEAVGLDPARAAAYPHEWSGGMQQRLLIAMALAQRPALLLADEPTSALDTLHQAQLLTLLRRLREERGFALLWVTHDLAVAAAVAERALVLNAGAVVEQGRAAVVFSLPRHAATAALVAAQSRLAARSGA